MNQKPPKAFSETYASLIKTSEDCLKIGSTVPALVIIYASIDGFSDLVNQSNYKGKSVFMKWVKTWMLTNYPLPCNEIDLYSARCGLLHTQHSDSSLIQESKAKRLMYCWGSAEPSFLQFAINKIGKEAIAIKIEDILNSFKLAMEKCLIAVYKDKEWKEEFEKKCSRLFVEVGIIN